MKHDVFVGFRITGELREELERERKRRSRKAGAEVQTSAVIRAILEEKLRRGKRKAEAAA